MKDVSDQMLAFKIRNIGFAIGINHIVTVEKAVKVTAVPLKSTSNSGIVVLHEEIFQLFDLSLIFFEKKTAVNVSQKMIFIREGDKKWVIPVDEILGIVPMNLNQISTIEGLKMKEIPQNKFANLPTIQTKFGSLVVLRNIEWQILNLF